MKMSRHDRHKARRRFGSHYNVAELQRLLESSATTGASRLTGLAERGQSLNRLGFNDYSDYCNSVYWQDKRREYQSTCLTQRCIVCGEAEVVLHHTEYGQLGSESVTSLMPLCERHHQKLHDFLAEYNLPYSCSVRALGIAAKLAPRVYGRQIEGYQRRVIEFLFSRCGWRVEFKGNGQRKTAAKTLVAKKDGRVLKYQFDPANMTVNRVAFEEFVRLTDSGRENLGLKTIAVAAVVGGKLKTLKFPERLRKSHLAQN